jgi:hypothetical protein
MHIVLLLLISVVLAGCKTKARPAAPMARATQSELLKASQSGENFEFIADQTTFRFHVIDAAKLPAEPEAAPFELHIDSNITRVIPNGCRNSISIESAFDEIMIYSAAARALELDPVAILKLGTSADAGQIDAVVEKLGEENFRTIALDLSVSKNTKDDTGATSK